MHCPPIILKVCIALLRNIYLLITKYCNNDDLKKGTEILLDNDFISVIILVKNNEKVKE